MFKCLTFHFVHAWRPARRSAAFWLLAAAMVAVLSATAQIAPTSPTTGWVALSFGNTNFPDAIDDQQAPSGELDLVGNPFHPSFYMNYQGSSPSSGWVAFRLRLAEDENPIGFKGAAFVGMDADLDGDLDLFLGVNNQGSGQLGLWGPGSGLNTSPATISLSSSPVQTYSITASIYAFTPVSTTIDPTAISLDLDGGGKTDRFLTFEFPLPDVSAALAIQGIPNFDADTPFRLVVATATQPNNFNGDFDGIVGGNNSPLGWETLGGITETYSFRSLTPIPEPGTAQLFWIAGGFFFLIMARRRSQF